MVLWCVCMCIYIYIHTYKQQNQIIINIYINIFDTLYCCSSLSGGCSLQWSCRPVWAPAVQLQFFRRLWRTPAAWLTGICRRTAVSLTSPSSSTSRHTVRDTRPSVLAIRTCVLSFKHLHVLVSVRYAFALGRVGHGLPPAGSGADQRAESTWAQRHPQGSSASGARRAVRSYPTTQMHKTNLTLQV